MGLELPYVVMLKHKKTLIRSLQALMHRFIIETASSNERGKTCGLCGMAAVMGAVAWLVDDPPNEMDSIVPRRDLNYCLFGPYLLRKARFWDLIYCLPL